jgi:hypothetical protein
MVLSLFDTAFGMMNVSRGGGGSRRCRSKTSKDKNPKIFSRFADFRARRYKPIYTLTSLLFDSTFTISEMKVNSTMKTRR